MGTRVLLFGLALTFASLLAVSPERSTAAETAPTQLQPGGSFTIEFPEMPPTLAEMLDPRGIAAQMTVALPSNYDPQRQHPLLIFLNGSDGGRGTSPTIARAITGDQDFVCVSLPLFRESVGAPDTDRIERLLVRDPDGAFAWPVYREMLARLEEMVPNLDPNHRVLGGSSNGAHMTAALVNELDGEAAEQFSAFFLVDGGGGLQRFDLLAGKPLLMVCGVWRPDPAPALAAGVDLTVYRMAREEHAFPPSEYPAVRAWLGVPESPVAAGVPAAPAQASLHAGDEAPHLKLQASDGQEYDLSQFVGTKYVALCWFPRAGSQGAINQCAALEAAMPEIPADRVQVLGCSTAPLDVTTTFAQEGGYSFPVLSDPGGVAARAWGCLRPDGLSERYTFLIDEQGVTVAVNRGITPQTQGTELLKMLADAGLIEAPATNVGAAAPEAAADSFVTYDYSEMDEGQEKAVRLAVPVGLQTIRGLLVNTNAAGGDTRDRYSLPYLKAFAALHDFAFVGAQAFNSHLGSVTVLEHALDRFAEESGHPELANVPFVVYGFSAGGGFANRLLDALPERVIASTPLSSPMRRMEIPDASLDVPVCMFSGELEDGMNPLLVDAMEEHRPRGARFAWAMLEGRSHQEIDQATLAIPFLDRCIHLRYPEDADPRLGPVVLRPLDLSSGWLADNMTWRSGLTEIAPYTDPGDAAATTSWLPDEDIAFIYRAYTTFAPPLTLTNPPSGATWVVPPGADLTVTVDDAGFPGRRALALYEGAHKLAEVGQGPGSFPLADLKPGVHAYWAMGTDAQGTQRVSRPALVIISKK